MERTRRTHLQLGLAAAATCIAAPVVNAGIVSGSVSGDGVPSTITTAPQMGVSYGASLTAVSFDINGGGDDVELYANYYGAGNGATTATLSSLNVKPVGNSSLSAPLAANTLVGLGTPFGATPNLALPDGTSPSPYYGIRLGTGTPSVYNYGWIQFTEGPGAGGYDTVTYGYETEVNTAIAVGATSVPLPTSALSALALGAVSMMKRRRSAL